MTTYTERSLGSTAYSARSLDTLSWTERGELDTTFCTTGTETATDTTAPVISNFHANRIATGSVELDWDTDEEANCLVYYGTAGQTTNLTLLSVGVTHEHYVKTNRRYVIDDLPAGTWFYCFPVSRDRYGNSRTGDYYSFKTADTGDAGQRPEEV